VAYCINEKDTLSTVRDFTNFCEYIGENRPTATKKGNLSPKFCYEINKLMSHPREGAKPTDHMPKYIAVSMYFRIALLTNLICLEAITASKTTLGLTKKYDDIRQMNPYTLYLLIFMSWMFGLDKQEAFEGDFNSWSLRGYNIDCIFEKIGKMTKSRWLTIDSSYLSTDPIDILAYHQSLAHHLSDLGLIEYETKEMATHNYSWSCVARVKPTDAGIALSKSCETRRFTWLNIWEDPMAQTDDDQDIFTNDFENTLPTEKVFFFFFLQCFPKNTIDYASINITIFGEASDSDTSNCVFRFKVQLSSRCYRIVQCAGRHTFEDLHDVIQQAFDFDNDHLYAFYPGGKSSRSRRSHHGIYAPFCNEANSADEIRLCDLQLFPNQRLTYLFDFGDQWEFTVTVLDVDQQAPIPLRPVVVESVGDAPEQYPNYDDYSE
jgi:hypothetical protein